MIQSVCGGFSKHAPVAQIPVQYLSESNSQQAMWETSHQQVRVKSAAGSQTRCLLLLSPSPLSACLSLYWQSVYLQVYMEVLVGPLSPRLLFWNALMSWHRAGRSGPAIWSLGSAGPIKHWQPLLSAYYVRASWWWWRWDRKLLKPEWRAHTPQPCMHTCMSVCLVLIPGCRHYRAILQAINNTGEHFKH